MSWNTSPFAPPAGPSDPGSGGVSAEQLNAALGAHNSSGVSHPGLQAALAEAVTTERSARQTADTALGARIDKLEQAEPGGGYEPPAGGIPRGDLADDVQEALNAAETALQTFTESDPVYQAERDDIAFKSDIPAPPDLSLYELLINKTAVTELSTSEEYANAKSVWDLCQAIAATIPPGGLNVPKEIDLESELPATGEDGDFYIIQDMDETKPGHTGKAWWNTDKWLKVFDQYYTADGESIVLTPTGRLSVDRPWLDSIIEAAVAGTLRKGTPGTYTQGVHFDGPDLPTFREFIDANISNRFFEGAVTLELHAQELPASEDHLIEHVLIGDYTLAVIASVRLGRYFHVKGIVGGVNIESTAPETARRVYGSYIGRLALRGVKTTLVQAWGTNRLVFQRGTGESIEIGTLTAPGCFCSVETGDYDIAIDTANLQGGCFEVGLPFTGGLTIGNIGETGGQIIAPGRPEIETFERRGLTSYKAVVAPDPTSLLSAIIANMPGPNTTKGLYFSTAAWADFEDKPDPQLLEGNAAWVDIQRGGTVAIITVGATNSKLMARRRVNSITTTPRWAINEDWEIIATQGWADGRFARKDDREGDTFITLPDNPRLEEINRIPENNGTWTVDRDGYVRLYAGTRALYDLNSSIF